MKVEHRSKTLEIPPRIRSYLNEKAGRFDKFFRKEPTLIVNLNFLRGKYTCELTLEISGRIIKASGQGRTWKHPSTRLLTGSMCRFGSSIRVYSEGFQSNCGAQGAISVGTPNRRS